MINTAAAAILPLTDKLSEPSLAVPVIGLCWVFARSWIHLVAIALATALVEQGISIWINLDQGPFAPAELVFSLCAAILWGALAMLVRGLTERPQNN